MLQNLWNPFRDWNLIETLKISRKWKSYKTSETLLGIETLIQKLQTNDRASYKTSETLLGIETIARSS